VGTLLRPACDPPSGHLFPWIQTRSRPGRPFLAPSLSWTIFPWVSGVIPVGSPRAGRPLLLVTGQARFQRQDQVLPP